MHNVHGSSATVNESAAMADESKGSGSGLGSAPPAAAPAPLPDRRRSRSLTVSGPNPLDTPLSAEESKLAALVKKINSENEEEQRTKPKTAGPGSGGPKARRQSFCSDSNPIDTPLTQTEFQLSAFRTQLKQEREAEERVEKAANRLPPGVVLHQKIPTLPHDTVPDNVWQATVNLLTRSPGQPPKMNYQNYIDSPGAGPGGNPRQAPPSPSQSLSHTNGMNGGMGMGMVGYPTPAGHQSDLNYVFSIVEELSGVLMKNQQVTASVIEKMGKVRQKAATLNLTNDEVIAAVAQEMEEDSKNLEEENSDLRKALDKAEYDKKENWKLACHGANILADITEKMHVYREKTDTDILAWHRNYRNQLAEEREENLNLRNQINDMRAAASRANEHLRQMRRHITDHPEWHELRVQNVALRQEKRWWKRMALPMLADDDSEFSDDDDLIDPEEKKRLVALKLEKERKDNEDNDGSGEGIST